MHDSSLRLDFECKFLCCVVSSVGVILWQLWSSASTPYASLSSDAAVRDAVLRDGCTLPIDPKWPTPIRNALQGCWRRAPSDRLSATQLVHILKDFQNHLPVAKTPYTSFHASLIGKKPFAVLHIPAAAAHTPLV
jgi:hypothetical protein